MKESFGKVISFFKALWSGTKKLVKKAINFVLNSLKSEQLSEEATPPLCIEGVCERIMENTQIVGTSQEESPEVVEGGSIEEVSTEVVEGARKVEDIGQAREMRSTEEIGQASKVESADIGEKCEIEDIGQATIQVVEASVCEGHADMATEESDETSEESEDEIFTDENRKFLADSAEFIGKLVELRQNSKQIIEEDEKMRLELARIEKTKVRQSSRRRLAAKLRQRAKKNKKEASKENKQKQDPAEKSVEQEKGQDESGKENGKQAANLLSDEVCVKKPKSRTKKANKKKKAAKNRK